jgi:hypothetical protein
VSTEPSPDAPDVVTLTAALVDAEKRADHWQRMFAAVVRAAGPTLVHPGDYAAVDPTGLDSMRITIPGYPDRARMFVLPEHAKAFVGGMMDALSTGVAEGGITLPDPSTFPGQSPDGSTDGPAAPEATGD